MTVFSWLHLTDFHYGMEEQDWLWPQFKQKFFDDLNLLHKECGPWDLVIFTGDITNQGLPEQFEGVNKILDDLWEHFNTLGFSPKLFVIPGNHDLTRPSDSSSTDFLNQWWNQIEKKKEFWRDEKSENRQFIDEIFKNYLAWFNENSQIEKNICKGMLPGDFSFTLEKSGTKLGIIGLNTSFLNLEDIPSCGINLDFSLTKI